MVLTTITLCSAFPSSSSRTAGISPSHHLRRHTKCIPGTYSLHNSGIAPCYECPPGSFSNVSGALNCTPARTGSYVPVSGATTDIPCPPGTYTTRSGSASCVACLPNVKCPRATATAPDSVSRRRSHIYLPNPSSSLAATRILRRPPKCEKPEEKACPVYSGGTGLSSKVKVASYECVNVANDLESCGGCPDPASSLGTDEAHSGGRDCSTILGVDSVRCEGGKCILASCRPGFVLSKDGERCEVASQD
ncbi:Protein priA [Hypsizygus marmoreus]|uniref:Protein priA n=1 Tax=Hypsizygus marmoreus TaxID=39966 RepID=A0A369J627_HYPMA|nr:Protein priA [Hypsizygus marmoreus]